jgi:pilus assembly protein CpaC
MYTRNNKSRVRLGTAMVALAISLGTLQSASPALAASVPSTYKPSRQMLLSVGEGQMINLPRNVASVWTSNPEIADVYVNGTKQINVFGKAFGQATIIATGADGSVVFGAAVTVSSNISNINEALHQAMPDSNITVTTIGQMAVLNGTVASPEDATQAETLVRSLLNAGIPEGQPLKILPVNRLKTATPLQVTLKVRIAEVNRSMLKQLGVNLLANSTGGFNFGIAQGGGIHLPDVSCVSNCGVPKVIRSALGSTLTASGHFLGLDILSSLDLAQTDGLATTLAEPNLTALSGETASFLAGGEFPIPVEQGNNAISVEYKQYGVGLAFTPIVLADGRISMRVRPEVSELSDAGSLKLSSTVVPSLVTRRAETTVELGSGQSFMIAGLLQNKNSNNVSKAPFLGDLPILGMLFRSTKFQRDETELVIVVTPYLVRPVSRQMASPTDGYRAPTDPQMILEGQSFTGRSGAVAPTAVPGPGSTPVAPTPGFSS